MTRVGRARERSETQGFMHVLVDGETRKILGAALLGIEADEAIHCIVDVMTAGAPVYRDHPRRAHPSDGIGAHSDGARRDAAAGLARSFLFPSYRSIAGFVARIRLPSDCRCASADLPRRVPSRAERALARMA